jgi:hypothetical protein
MYVCGLNLAGSKYEAARGCCEHGNKHSVLHKCGQILDHLTVLNLLNISVLYLFKKRH